MQDFVLFGNFFKYVLNVWDFVEIFLGALRAIPLWLS